MKKAFIVLGSRPQTPILLGVLLATQMGATDCGGIIEDDGFDLWCGDQLCSWKLERGDIARVPTWNDNDSGVSFVGTDTAIEQLSPVTDFDGHCMTFSMVANVASNAEMYLNIDIGGDGTVERSERIPTAHWKPLTYAILVAPPFDGIRFELAKKGGGEAILAQVDGQIAGEECAGLDPISAAPRLDGSRCNVDSECASNKCRPQYGSYYCVGCDDSGCTNPNETCGAGDPASSVVLIPQECVAKNAKQLGEHCFVGDECASTLCIGQTCSACTPAANNGQCADGRACGPAYTNTLFSPYVCGPGEHGSATGVACGTDADCASGHCNGTEREQCDDGRACETAESCPSGGGLTPGSCTTVGVAGGTCQ